MYVYMYVCKYTSYGMLTVNIKSNIKNNKKNFNN